MLIRIRIETHPDPKHWTQWEPAQAAQEKKDFFVVLHFYLELTKTSVHAIKRHVNFVLDTYLAESYYLHEKQDMQRALRRY
jgi:hypothetical protein